MTTSMSGAIASRSANSSSAADRDETHPVARARKAQATILTIIALGISIGLYVMFGLTGLVLFAIGLPVGFLLLWHSADVVRHDER